MSSNKLRKPPTMSATMTLASRYLSSPVARSVDTTHNERSPTMVMQPLTATEQYWATRALKAEALLSAQENHKNEVKILGHEQEMKLQRELAALTKEHKEKHSMLEKLLVFLLILIGILLFVIVYLSMHYVRHSMQIQQKQHEKWWAAIGASHFTIPILSPFTSVIEQETSVIGSKTITTIAAIISCLVYLAFRHWLSSKTKPVASTFSRVISTMGPAIDR